MALIIKDRVKEVTTSTGTGDVSLGGATATFDAFQSVMSNGDTTFYAIVHTESGVDEWEVGLGTFNTGGTLSRTTVYSGSNGTSAVNFSSGNKDIFMTYPASKAAVAGEDVTFADVTATDITSTGTVTLSADPSSSLQAATKQYVDTIAAAGIHYHTPVRVEHPSNLNATYNNGSSGVGATLTNAGTNAALVLDNVNMALNDRVLVANQTDQTQNGVYTVTTVGDGSTAWVLTRSTDTDTAGPSDPDAFGKGDAFFIKEGDTNAGHLDVLTTTGTIVFGTTNIVFSEVAETSIYSAGTGLTLTGTTFSTNQDISTSASPTFAGGTFTGNVDLGDDDYIRLGDSQDLQIYHNASHSVIKDAGTGNLNLLADNFRIANAGWSKWYFIADNGGAATVFWNGQARLATSSGGIDVTGNITVSGSVDGRDVATDGTKLDGIETGATADQSASEILTAIKTVDGAGSNLDADLLDGQQGSYYLNTGTTFSGDVSGTYNNIVVANDSHTHDGRYYTETEADSRFVNVTGDTMSGNLTVSKTNPLIRLYDSNTVTGSYAAIEFDTANNQGIAIQFNEFDGELPVGGYGLVVKESSTNTQFPSTGTLSFNVLGDIYAGATSLGSLNKVFHDGYHPNADKWTTARTLSLSGDASGSVSWDGSANATLSVTVANDSHNHTNFTVSGITDLNSISGTASNKFRPFTSNFQASNRPAANYAGGFEIGVASSSDNYRGQLAFVAGGANEGPYVRTKTSGTWNSWNEVWHSGNDGSGSGLDADLLDGNHASAFATSGHNHTYNVNDSWLRDNGDNAHVKLYGNSRQMVFRTDGTTEYASAVGGYPFAWMYGGDASSNRRMLLNSVGDLWTSTNGWLSTALSGKLSTTGKAADSELLDGIDSGSFVRSDADDSLYGNYIFGSSGNIKIRLKGSSDPMIMLHESNTERAYMMWDSTNNALRFRNLENDYFDFYTHGNLGGIALRLMGADGDRWGSIYATDNEEIGFLDEGNSWVYKITNDSKHEWSIFNSEYMELNTTGLTLWHSGADALNFANSSTNDARGISFNGRTALSADYNDGYLRLNYGSEFTNGVYVYGNLLNSGNVTTNNVYLSDGLYHQGDTNTYFKFPGNDQITIATGGTDRIIVNSTGVRLGDTGNGYFQPVSGNYGSIQIDGGAHGGWEGYGIGGRIVFMHDNNTATGIFNDVENEWIFYGHRNGYTRMYYDGSHKVETTSTGVTVTGDVNSTSDIRYKKNIETIDNALEKVQSLRGVNFDWDNDAFKEDDSTKKPNFTERATGVIAQDVEKVLPEAVRENEDGFKNVAYGNMVGLLIEAIKEQQEQIDALKKQLNG